MLILSISSTFSSGRLTGLRTCSQRVHDILQSSWVDSPKRHKAQKIDRITSRFIASLIDTSPTHTRQDMVQELHGAMLQGGRKTSEVGDLLFSLAEKSRPGTFDWWLSNCLLASIIQLGSVPKNMIKRQRLSEWKKVITFVNLLITELHVQVGIGAFCIHPVLASKCRPTFLRSKR